MFICAVEMSKVKDCAESERAPHLQEEVTENGFFSDTINLSANLFLHNGRRESLAHHPMPPNGFVANDSIGKVTSSLVSSRSINFFQNLWTVA